MYDEMGGVSRALHVLGDDQREYLIKGPARTPDQPGVAANEIICARLASLLSLSVLPHRIAELGGDLYFASEWMGIGTYYPLMDANLLAKCDNRDEIYRVVVFDALTCNDDRHAANLLVKKPKGRNQELMLLNDHGHALRRPEDKLAELPSKVHLPLSNTCQRFIRPMIRDRAKLQSAVNRLRSLRDIDIEIVVASVPTSLLDESDRAPYVRLLSSRRARLDSMFRDDSAIFPNLV